MKRIVSLIIAVVFAGMAFLIPGCDELVTTETNSYDTVTLIVYDSNCVKVCHSDIGNEMLIPLRQWRNSGHSSDSLTDYDYFSSNTRQCGPECHTSEGFVQSLSSTADTNRYPTEIGCFACHQPHTTWDFSLRDTSAVTLIGGAEYDRGYSNICARCHKATASPPATSGGTVSITDTWGPHSSPQADMLSGTGGFQYTDSTYQNSSHMATVTSGCLTCHQDSSVGFTLGGHSLRMRDGSTLLTETCNRTDCHSTTPIADFETYDTLQIAYIATLDTLKAKLISINLLDATGNIIPQSTDSTDLAAALFNYLFVKNDRSNGVHNTRYGLALMRQSLNYIGR
jgi:hypothetical protein